MIEKEKEYIFYDGAAHASAIAILLVNGYWMVTTILMLIFSEVTQQLSEVTKLIQQLVWLSLTNILLIALIAIIYSNKERKVREELQELGIEVKSRDEQYIEKLKEVV